MKKYILTPLFLLLSIHLSFAGIDDLLPKPQHIKRTNDKDFSLQQPLCLELPFFGENAPAIKEELTQLVLQNGGEIRENTFQKITISIVDKIENAEFQEEAYQISVNSQRIIIKATTPRGAYWAVQTLWQLNENQHFSIPSCEITDWSAFSIRGYMHDIGRSYIAFEELKNQIVRLSRFKINTFHWHLTDNQGWRLESKIYPQLNANTSYSRFQGKYYTIEQAKELVLFAKKHGVTVIPEIDMPGHSEAFRKAMGHSMLTDVGLTEMKAIIAEACDTFSETEWIHIGSDEVRTPDKKGATLSAKQFISQMTAFIHSKGKKIVVWNPGNGYSANDIDMTQMWSSRGRPTKGIPAIDSRYHYINHFDQYADIVSLYNSTIAQQNKGSQQFAGTIIGIWNDRLVASDKDIIVQNAFYQVMLAIAERAWLGGGKGYFTEIGTTLKDSDTAFKDWERRFLHHKNHFLKNEPIAYVRQTNVRWNITDQFPNEGDINKVFPPEKKLQKKYEYKGKNYNVHSATGAGIYLRHTWGTLIPSFYSDPKPNHTAYAYTFVYSPINQQVGLQIEFQNYGRSEADLPPPQGKWDYNNSKIWINDNIINPPVWKNTHTKKSNEIKLANENYSARKPIKITLHKGWNKVLIKLPNQGFRLPNVRLVKWAFTCVFTTLDGKHAVDNLIYSPDCLK
ncbi:MAG: family 20 glycosylhydrolase [Flavobacteriaceae bacterium]|nr:family 20 glycosylhydrolase [Flavobacteriaceae bacterium]